MILLERKIQTLILLIVIFPLPSNADFICRSEIHYKWRPSSQDKKDLKGEPTANAEGTPITSPGSPNEQGVFWSVVEKKAPTEEESKKLVADAAVLQRSNADRACRLQHENLTNCVANKFSALSSTLNSLTFSARRALEEAVTTDCEKQQGQCLSSSVSDPICIEKKVEEVQAEAGDKAEKEKGKKDKKK